MKKAYCTACLQPVKAGYCSGTRENPHQPEPCPPCTGCSIQRCTWRDGVGCARFKPNARAEEAIKTWPRSIRVRGPRVASTQPQSVDQRIPAPESSCVNRRLVIQ